MRFAGFYLDQRKLTFLAYTGSIIISVCLIFVLLLTSIELLAFDLDFYQQQYELLDRPEAIGIEENDLLAVTEEMLDYLAGNRESLDIRAVIQGRERYVFNRREIMHMVDVRDLFLLNNITRNLLLISLIVILIILSLIFRKSICLYLAKTFALVTILFLTLLGSLALFAYFEFTQFWILFHYLTFDNYLWLLDPRTDVLIQMVPEPFFFNAVMRIVLYFVTALFIGLSASIGVIFVSKRKVTSPVNQNF